MDIISFVETFPWICLGFPHKPPVKPRLTDSLSASCEKLRAFGPQLRPPRTNRKTETMRKWQHGSSCHCVPEDVVWHVGRRRQCRGEQGPEGWREGSPAATLLALFFTSPLKGTCNSPAAVSWFSFTAVIQWKYIAAG